MNGMRLTAILCTGPLLAGCAEQGAEDTELTVAPAAEALGPDTAEGAGPGQAEEANRLIARGDAAKARANELRREAAALKAADPAAPRVDAGAQTPSWTGGATRAGTTGAPDSPREDSVARIARIEADAAALEAEAETNWQRALTLDADAQDAILQRMRSIRPAS